jgi:hypothetical protein
MTWLRAQGIRVNLGNVSFSRLSDLCTERVGPLGWVVDGSVGTATYFPEEAIATWLRERDLCEVDLIAFERGGVIPLQESLQAALDRFGADTLLLVDGGTDSLLKGDEADLATVDEDAASLVAAEMTKAQTKLLACIGFGIDTHHGICHHSFLENVSEAIRLGGHLGCVSVTRESDEGQAFIDAVDFLSSTHAERSIVQTSIADAIGGAFGNVHRTERTAGSDLFINPLMSTYWTFDLPTVVGMMGFRDRLMATNTFMEVEAAIRAHHGNAIKRDWTPLPY